LSGHSHALCWNAGTDGQWWLGVGLCWSDAVLLLELSVRWLFHHLSSLELMLIREEEKQISDESQQAAG